MKKPQQLRDHLLAAIPELEQNPDRLLIYVDTGHIHNTLANGLSYEYSYTLNLILTDFVGDLATVTVPLLDWIRVNQSELAANLDDVKKGIQFEADILDNDRVDLAISLPLTERVIVKQDANTIKIDYPGEPQYERATEPQQVTIYDKDDKPLAKWLSRSATTEFF